MKEQKGVYRSTVQSPEGQTYVTERGFTFREDSGRELSFDVHEHETGMAMLFGDQIFFLGFWTEEQLEKASSTFNEAIEREKARRKGLTNDT